MPLHDVKCSYCGHIEEIFYQPSDEPKDYICDQCGEFQNYKPLLGSPIIKMAGARPVEKELEKSAADGLF